MGTFRMWLGNTPHLDISHFKSSVSGCSYSDCGFGRTRLENVSNGRYSSGLHYDSFEIALTKYAERLPFCNELFGLPMF